MARIRTGSDVAVIEPRLLPNEMPRELKNYLEQII